MGTKIEIPDDAFMQGVPIVSNVVVDMYWDVSPHDPLVADFVGFIQGFILTARHGLSPVYVDDVFLESLLKRLDATAVVEFKVIVAWTYRVLLDADGQHHLEISLHPYSHADLVGYTVQ